MTKIALTGVALLVALALAAVAGAFLLGGPLSHLWKAKAQTATNAAEVSADDASARGLEAKGTADLAAVASDLQTAAATLQRKTNALELETRADPATAARIPDGELARLRDHDRLLCSEAPGACDGAPATP